MVVTRAALVRDNKTGTTFQGGGRLEKNGTVRDSNMSITTPMPGGEPKAPGGK
jgi:hypothetical protein